RSPTRRSADRTDSDPGFAAGFRQSAYSPDIGLALRYRNDAAGVQQIEKMAGLETAIVGRKRQTLFKKVSAFALGILEVAEEALCLCVLEVKGGKLSLGLQADI